MKARILSFVFLMSLSAVLFGQTTGNCPKRESCRSRSGFLKDDPGQLGPMKGLGLTDAQKEAFMQGRLALQKQLQPLRGELDEAEAHQKTLMTADKPDLAAIDKNIEKIGGLRVEIAKIAVKHHLGMRAQLTDEQRLRFDHMKDKMGKRKRAMKDHQMEGPHDMN